MGIRAMEIEVKIRALMMDPNSGTPIIILKDVNSETMLPIWVGIFEANAIALEIEKIAPPRPMTHDLLKNLIVGLDAQIDRVVITELKEKTFYAIIHLQHVGGVLAIDARPSDAIALALRMSSAIYVDSQVLSKARNMDMTADSADNERLRKWLETLDEKELGKYEM